MFNFLKHIFYVKPKKPEKNHNQQTKNNEEKRFRIVR